MSVQRAIIVVGGYGVVGRRIAARLARRFPGRIVIAGRNVERAEALCHQLGRGTRARRIDVNDVGAIGAALNGAGTVVACVAQPEMHLLCEAIDRGVAYTDIAPRLAFWQGAEQLASEARRTGARIVLGAGLSPGISNMMAAQLADALGRVDRIETTILLSLGDEYGPDSLHHVVEAMKAPFSITVSGHHRSAVPFSDGARVTFPKPLGRRTAYLFPWSDVVYYPMTLGAHTSVGRFALEPAWAGRLASIVAHAWTRGWIESPAFLMENRGAIERLEHHYAGQDRFALVVTVEGNGRVLRMSLSGCHQADVTADAAAEISRMLASDEIAEPGVWLPEQVVQPEPFFASLESSGWKPKMEVVSAVAVMGSGRRRYAREVHS